MNPQSFPNVGAGGMPGGPNAHGQMLPQNTQLFRQVVQVLQSQAPFTGWRAEVPPAERAMKVWQMYAGLPCGLIK
jgi:hypothetical protein